MNLKVTCRIHGKHLKLGITIFEGIYLNEVYFLYIYNFWQDISIKYRIFKNEYFIFDGGF
ncbi:MAG TPA: hypothetical protein DDW65_25520 [Firmicutes bacterium]|nr:hypothetical protein [Bacillota bacterium]